MTELALIEETSKEGVMIEQTLNPEPRTGELIAEDTALQLFQIAALMLGDEQGAVSLVEEALAGVETDPCAEGTLAYAEARTQLVKTAVQQMVKLHPDAFAAPEAQAGEASCLETDGLGDEVPGDPFAALLAGTGKAGMRDWLEQLAPALRTIFVLRAVAGQNSEETAENLRQSGATGAQAWRRDLVGNAYRQALCSLATCLVGSRGSLMPA